MIIRETQEVETGYRVIGCVDDDPLKKGLRVLGVPVLGPVEALAEVSREAKNRRNPDCDSIGYARPRCAVCGTLQGSEAWLSAPSPTMAELIAGRVTLQQVREVSLTDLLGRIPVDLDLESVREHIRDRVSW